LAVATKCHDFRRRQGRDREDWRYSMLKEVVDSLLLVLVGSRRFELHAINAVHAVDEQNENEDERNLHLSVG
jgi:hypothetical protein